MIDKKLTLLALLIISGLAATAQKTRYINVLDTRSAIITGIVSFDEDNVPIDTLYVMQGQNAKYSSIIDIITIRSGTVADIKAFLNICLQTLENEEDQTRITEGKNDIYVTKMLGVKYLMVYGSGSDSNGYILISKNPLKKILSKL